jgi:hypothetical protein
MTWYLPNKPKGNVSKNDQDPVSKILPWYKGTFDVDEHGKVVYIKNPFEMISSIRISDIFMKFPLFVMVIVSLGFGFVFGIMFSRDAVISDPDINACINAAKPAILERAEERLWRPPATP